MKKETCPHCNEEIGYCTCEDELYYCQYCPTQDENKHAIQCPNNTDPFDQLINLGYD